MVNLFEFLEQGIEAQQSYTEASGTKGPLDNLTKEERHLFVIEHLSHLMEEAMEVRMLVPRRSWKKYEPSYLDSEEGVKDFCHELTDILLFFRAVLSYSGIDTNTFQKHFLDKMDYNKTRPDHLRKNND